VTVATAVLDVASVHVQPTQQAGEIEQRKKSRMRMRDCGGEDARTIGQKATWR
jgi:hypothetical protein